MDVHAEFVANTWNLINVPGRAVVVRRDNGDLFKTVTRTEAFVCGSGEPVVFLEGIRGSYALDRVSGYEGTDEDVDYGRASGLCVCESCGKTYYKHPADLEHLGKDWVPFLVRLCDGSLVKL